MSLHYVLFLFFFQAEDGIRDHCVTGVQTCALPIYGDLVFRAGIRETARRCVRHEVEVRRLPANDGADDDERVVPFSRREAPSGIRKLPRTGHPHEIHVVGRCPVTDEGIHRTVSKLARDLMIESRRDDRVPTPFAVRRAVEFRHVDQDASRWPSLSRLTPRYPAFSLFSGWTMATRSSTRSPYPSSPTILRGLFVMGRMEWSPRSSRICAPMP